MINRGEGKIKADFGSKDYYKYYCQNSKNPQSKQKFNKVIDEFNKAVVDLIINEGLEFRPVKLGMTFCVRKIQKIPRIEDNKLINNAPIDWKATKLLWKENILAAEKKTLIRFLNNHTSKYVFNIKIVKGNHFYTNKQYYRFKPCRSFQRNLAKRILDPSKEVFDTYKLY